jgi:SAM-dependent methyltransferase
MTYNPSSYWNDIFDKGVNAQSVCYPDWPMSYNHFLHQQQLTTLESIIASLQIQLKEKNILEIGPGAGFWTSFFQHQQPNNYVGIDISLPVINSLQNNFPNQTFIQSDIGSSSLSEMPIPKSNLIFAAMVFLHITDNKKLEHAFKEFQQQLTNDGYIIFLDAIASKKVFGNALKQTDGPDFDSSFHNKIRHLSFYEDLAKRNQLTLVKVIPAFNTSQFCFDFHSYLGYLIWGKIFYAIHRRILNKASETTGKRYSIFQQMLEFLLTKVLKMEMSSKWIILKK